MEFFHRFDEDTWSKNKKKIEKARPINRIINEIELYRTVFDDQSLIFVLSIMQSTCIYSL